MNLITQSSEDRSPIELSTAVDNLVRNYLASFPNLSIEFGADYE